MASILTSLSNTANNVLNTVSTVANTATQSVNSAASAFDMIDTYVTAAKERQLANTAADMDSFYEELAERKALENAERQQAIVDKLLAKPELSKLYTENHNRLKTVIDAVRNRNNPKS